jgi:hypothetical protein
MRKNVQRTLAQRNNSWRKYLRKRVIAIDRSHGSPKRRGSPESHERYCERREKKPRRTLPFGGVLVCTPLNGSVLEEGSFLPRERDATGYPKRMTDDT